MSEFARSLAVVIGINNYQNGIPKLKTAVPDAEAIADRLTTNQDYKIFPEVIVNAAATSDRLKTLLKEELPKQVGKDDRLVFYFAGHGIALDGQDGPEGYVLPQNAKPGDKGSMLPMQMLHDELAKLNCRHLLLILDCCFAGAFRWSANYRDVGLEEDLNEQRYQYFIQQPAWQIITSAGSDERAIDVLALSDQRGQVGSHSPFAQVLLDGLAGKADRYPAAKNGAPAGDGVITANELITYIESEFSERLQDQAINQTPGLWCFRKHGNGRYIFDHPDHPRNLKYAPPLDESTNPYRGLKAFEREDKDLFFGRSELTDKLTEFVKQRPLTVVLGTSGAGKSSLVKAGLIPHIEALQNGQRWAILPFRPENSPFAALNQVLGERGLPAIKNPLQSKATDPSLEEALGGWLQAHPDMQLLVVIDQFEELVTLSGSKERQLFLEALATAIVKYARQLHLVITLRSDFEPQFKDSPLAPFWNNDNFFVATPMNRADLRQAIEKPAAKRTFFFESDDPENSLVDRLINEVEGMPGALPLLSFALSQLYLKYLGRQEATRKQGLPPIDRAVTEADYKALGSVQQSITKRADEIYNQLRQGNVSKAVLEKVRQKFRESSDVNKKSAESQIQQVCDEGVSDRVIRNVMLRMVSTTGGARSRRQVQCSELEYPESDCIQVAIVLETFEQERLLTTDKDAAGNPYIEPAHDALILNWSKINLWLNERQDKVETKKQFAPLVALKSSLLKLTRPASLKVPEAVKLTNNGSKAHRAENGKEGASESERLEPSNNGSDTPLKVNLQLQRDLTNAADKWDSARKGKSVEQNGQDPNAEESEDKGKNKKAREKPPKKAVEWLWDDDPRLRSVEQISLSADNWLNTVETMFVSKSIKKRGFNTRRNWSIAIGIIISLTGATFYALYQLQQVQRRQVEQLAATSKALLPTQPVEAEVNAIAAIGLSQSAFVQFPDYPQFANAEDSLLNAQRNNSERQRFRQEAVVYSIAFSPDGKNIVSGSSDNTVRLWDAQTGAPRLKLTGHKAQVFFVAFSPDGKTIVSGSKDKTVGLWDAQTGVLKRRLTGHKAMVNSVAFSPDGKTIVSGSRDKTIGLWDAQTGALKRRLTGHEDVINSVAFSPDGKTVVSGSEDKTVRLWDARTGALKRRLTGHEDVVNSVAFSPDGKTVVSGSGDKTVRLWDAQTGSLKHKLTGHEDVVSFVAFSPDGKTVVSGSGDKTVRLWDAQTGSLKHKLTGHEDIINSVAFSPDGKTIASSSGDATVRLWDAQTKVQLTGHGDVVSSAIFSPDGKIIASGSWDKTVRLWDTQTGSLMHKLIGHEDQVMSVAFSPDGKTVVSGSGDKTVRLWDAQTGALRHKLVGGGQIIMSVAFSPDGKTIASGSWDGTVRLWNVQTGALKHKLTGQEDIIFSVAFSPDGKTIASGSGDKTARLWDAQTGSLKGKPLIGAMDQIMSVAFSPDGKTIISGSRDGSVQLWDVQTETLKGKPLTGSMNQVMSVAFSPNGKTIVSGSSDGTVRLWDAQTGTLEGKPLIGHEAPVMSVAFSPDGRTIVSGSGDKTVRLWDASLASLQMACQQLQYHSILTDLTTVAKEAQVSCQKAVWSKQ